MPTFRVHGADATTGAATAILLTADTQQNAALLANGRGVMVSAVDLVPDDDYQPPAGARTAAVSPARVACASIAGLGMLATFLPWAHVPIVGAVAGTRGDGWFSFAGFGLALLVAISPGPRRALHPWRRVTMALLGLGCAGLGVQKVLALTEARRDAEAEGGLAGSLAWSIQIGNGVWLILLCGVALVVAAAAVRR